MQQQQHRNRHQSKEEESQEMWVFGYGSLIWKVDFPYSERVPGYVKGFVRRFWQGSTDHRGTLSQPGRVVTLIPSSHYIRNYKDIDTHSVASSAPLGNEDMCHGIVYRVPQEKVAQVKRHLDVREQDGYSTYSADVYCRGGRIIRNALVYVADDTNSSFLGPSDLYTMASEIAFRRGLSGWNHEYLFGLYHSMQELNVHDLHVAELYHAVRRLLSEKAIKETEKVLMQHQVSSAAAAHKVAVSL